MCSKIKPKNSSHSVAVTLKPLIFLDVLIFFFKRSRNAVQVFDGQSASTERRQWGAL